MAKGEGHPDLAGSYGALTLGRYDREYGKIGSHDKAYFLGQSETEYGANCDKTAVLECGECGLPGCWPFAVKISVLPDVVMWSDFEQPHRSWDYSKLGPFRFDLQEYQAQLLKLQESA